MSLPQRQGFTIGLIRHACDARCGDGDGRARSRPLLPDLGCDLTWVGAPVGDPPCPLQLRFFPQNVIGVVVPHRDLKRCPQDVDPELPFCSLLKASAIARASSSIACTSAAYSMRAVEPNAFLTGAARPSATAVTNPKPSTRSGKLAAHSKFSRLSSSVLPESEEYLRGLLDTYDAGSRDRGCTNPTVTGS